ncbi:MAG: ATP-binding cassette subfamily B protein [Saprospiraceae bacterium]|jgi:ATP-binding cassette subfamily B protein
MNGEEVYFSNIKITLLAWLALLMCKSLLSFGTRYLIGSTGETITATLRTCIYDHLQALPLSYHQERQPGDTLAILGNDAEVISRFVTGTLVQLLPLFVTLLGAFVMMALIEPGIALLATGLLPVYFVTMKLVGRRIRPLTRRWIDSYSDMFSFVQENLGLLPAIKAFTRESLESERFEQKNSALLSVTKQQLFFQSLLSPTISLLAGIGLLSLLWLASERLLAGQITTASLVSLLLYAVLLTHPISSLADVYGQIQKTRGAAERILALLTAQADPMNEGKPLQIGGSGRIRFEQVSYSYPGRAEVLSELSLDIQSGETVAIVGENGAGKSTLVHLLMRLIEADKGRILIDETDIQGVSLTSLRSQIGLVAQHTLLLNGSVSDNIAYGRPLSTQEEIEKAAKDAHAHEFIALLPKGYDTLIGNQGLRLSGGQRQRISLARTLLINPLILILDEATSMLDPAGEESFITECHHLLSQKTTILITHRPTSLALADRVLRLKNAKITPLS